MKDQAKEKVKTVRMSNQLYQQNSNKSAANSSATKKLFKAHSLAKRKYSKS